MLGDDAFTDVEFIELYRDRAIAAAHALARLEVGEPGTYAATRCGLRIRLDFCRKGRIAMCELQPRNVDYFPEPRLLWATSNELGLNQDMGNDYRSGITRLVRFTLRSPLRSTCVSFRGPGIIALAAAAIAGAFAEFVLCTCWSLIERYLS
jgi:hypothetical protein